ncbi:MAG TPA: ATP-binding cassette domain-containing protein [Acidimicrobiales bacterium]|nr:ATP-binding cassette domain-containing protein [Acidimicrobiales bacterium]
MRTAADPTTASVAGSRRSLGAAVDVLEVTQITHGRTTLHDVSFSVAPGEVVAIVGGSGAGKTTLLETMVGIRPPASGGVRIAGARSRSDVGYAPQDDIIHRDLPLARTLRYAAQLRLPADTPPDAVDRVVDDTLASLDLAERRTVRVGSLSGGQRKRASIAVEMLTRPDVFFLDEPTSGLDPATAREVLGVLRRLAGAGTTIVLTTHSPTDIDLCDRIVFLARDGYLAFVGTPGEARRHFATDDLTVAYERLALEETPEAWARRFAAVRRSRDDQRVRHVSGAATRVVDSSVQDGPLRPDRSGGRDPLAHRRAGPLRQWYVLTRRSADLLVRNRLTLAVLVGSPALVITMMAVLFRPGAFDAAATSSAEATQTVFWLAFAGFFFGLTYGLLQIVGEMAILRRERLAGLHLTAYVGSKVAVLTPVLVVVAAGMLAVLRALDRLPSAGVSVYAALLVTLTLEALAALALGLLASASVTDASQATLALPMLCFPQVLFAGAIVPVPDMAGPGQAMSLGLANRWAFESLGRALGLDRLVASRSPSSSYQAAFAGSPVEGWAVLAGFTGLLLVATVAVLRRRAPA